MITIRACKNVSEPTLIGLEATLTTPHGAYGFSCNDPVVDATSPFDGGLFGGIAWPRSRFQIRSDLVLEQQIFVSQETTDIAISWELRGHLIPAHLVVRPYFAGCGPRTYRDVGFRFESEENGGRLVWLANVRGPKIIADTNGRYSDEPVRSPEAIASAIRASSGLTAPGVFEFELSNRPSVLILSTDGAVKSQRNQYVGQFLASLMPSGCSPRPAFIGPEPVRESANCLVVKGA
jgi:hypothetical protein